ncbi:MAG: DUF1501 domain-containing protein [Bryobacterales bacterium]|nr:DUF1501 domain-containing protein [Bryobacterales bacterium]
MSKCCGPIKLTRRQMLAQAASFAAFTAAASRSDAQIVAGNVRPRNTAKACIFINLAGAPSHLDTFDAKEGPWNPPDADIRGYSGGLTLSRTMFPGFSKITGDLLFLRSVQSWEAAHERGQFYMQTAHPSNPAFVAETPHMGAVTGLEKSGAGQLPPFLTLNGSAGAFQGATFLSGKMEPLAAPSNTGGLSTIEHNFFGAQSQSRFDGRFKLMEQLDQPLRSAPPDKLMANHAEFYTAARGLMYDPAISAVFRFTADDDGRYGNTGFGRSCIVARNAIRAKNGTSFVNITLNGWDTHQQMFDRGYGGNMYDLCNNLDRSVSALVEDLKASGDFASTLIVAMGEFGRTPGTLNVRGGRDHHKFAMSVAMMGGGVRGGRAIGSTDDEGDRIETPGWSQDRPIVMEDLAATIYSALGINWTKSITDTPSGRRFEYVPYATEGRYRPVDEVFA